jgi:hypothetical protein
VDQPVNTPAYCLTGQVAVVTGASGGIGRAIALELAKAGADVIVHGHRRRDAAQSVAAEIQQLGRVAHVLLADLAHTDQCHQFASAAWNWRGHAEIWINTAGADVLTGPASSLSAAEKLDLLMRVDLRGTVLASWQAADLMTAQESGGVIINMSWDHVLTGMEGRNPQMYSAVNTTLYRYFAIVGGVYQVGSIVAALVLAFMLRKDGASFRWAAAGALCLLLAFAVWLAVVAPVNGQVAEALRAAPGSVPALWMELRARWEGGHAAGFMLQLLGLGALIWSVLPHNSALHRGG